MKKFVIIIFSLSIVVGLGILTQQFVEYINEPKVIEVLPIVYKSGKAVIDPEYPEPVRVVFDKDVRIQDFQVYIYPKAKLKPSLRNIFLRNVPQISNPKLYPAFVLQNKGLALNTQYTVLIIQRNFNIFRNAFEKPVRVVFKTTKENVLLPKESAEDLDRRLLN